MKLSLMKFSIRDLMWLTVVVALAVGWEIEHARYLKIAEEAKNRTAESDYWQETITKLSDEVARLKGILPNTSAPAPNPPKK